MLYALQGSLSSIILSHDISFMAFENDRRLLLFIILRCCDVLPLDLYIFVAKDVIRKIGR